MSRKVTALTPDDEEILSYNNVPVDVAAKYIGWSSCNIYWALQQERAPFGFAAQTGESKNGRPTFTYNISPGMLVKYKHGELQTWKLNEVIKLAADGIQELLDSRMEVLDEMMAIMSGKPKCGRRAG